MSKKYPNIDSPTDGPFFMAAIEDHPFVDLIEEILGARGILNLEAKFVQENSVNWTYYDSEQRLSYWFSVSRDHRQKLYVTMNIGFALIPNLYRVESAMQLLRANTTVLAPVRYAVILENIVALEFSCHIDWLTSTHLIHRVESMIEMAIHSQEKFINEESTLIFLPDDFFKTPLAI